MRFPSAKTAVTILLIVLWAGTIALNWPGHLSLDSLTQLLEGRTGHYETWHPPAMSWLLGIADAITPGAGLFAALDITLIYGALLLLVNTRATVSWVAVPVILVCAATPQFYLYQGIVWKDVLFAGTAVAGFACLSFAASRWQQQSFRSGLLALSLLLLSLAALTRQNGIVLSLMSAPAVAAIAYEQDRRFRPALRQGLIFLVALIAVIFASGAALETRADGGKGRRDEIKMLQLYDLSGAASFEPDIPLDDLRKHDPAFEHLIRADGAHLFTPQRVDPLQLYGPLESARDNAPISVTTAQWRHLILDYPLLYLSIRAEIFRWVFITPDIDKCLPFVVGLSGPQRTLQALHMPERYDDRDAALENATRPFVHTALFSHVTFAALGVMAFVLLLRRRTPADVPILFLLAGSTAFTMTFFAVSLACDYRYLYLLDISAMVAVIHAALGPDLEKTFTRAV